MSSPFLKIEVALGFGRSSPFGLGLLLASGHLVLVVGPFAVRVRCGS